MIFLNKNYELTIGSELNKNYKFDLGNEKMLVICKSSSWKNNSSVPKNIFHAWNVAMYSFRLVPENYEKIFFVEMDYSQRHCETLLQYYIRNNYVFIPEDVKCYDYFSNYEQGYIDEYSFEKIKSVIGVVQNAK